LLKATKENIVTINSKQHDSFSYLVAMRRASLMREKNLSTLLGCL